ncbi:MAG TPA: hypothetical protein VIQ80_01850 [Candidatus Saccharimonadales bacterium]
MGLALIICLLAGTALASWFAYVVGDGDEIGATLVGLIGLIITVIAALS